ncbi:hypothetical protein BGZ96_000514 [Linnemannia gamsii]|uniref:Uncharacterized protein n=1 Tax=Linnemannia gamsii TaxID=64522 RepID=A0ABQ7K9Y0_9FUNG|nr:hypothetical protein BGZ96_000514 [Linnemannia gamsii]
MDNSRRPRLQRPLSDSKDGHLGDRNTKTSPYTLSLARSLIDQLPDHMLRDVLHSVAYLTLVQEALVTSTLPPASTESFRSKRPKRSSPTPSGSRHGSLSPRPSSRPTSQDLSALTLPGTQSMPLTPQMQQTRKQLLTLIHRVNVYYSNTFNTAEAVTCLLNIAHRALDQQSVPIRSPTPTTPEPTESATISGSSLPTPPWAMETDTASPSPQPRAIIPIADDILSSLVMILIQYPRYKHNASRATRSQEERSARTGNEIASDDCDLTDALLEMVYALLDHEQYSQRPLAIRLSEFLVQVALQRERAFQDQERQRRKSLFSTRSNSFSSDLSSNRWRHDLRQLGKTSGSGVVRIDHDSGIGMDRDLIGGAVGSEMDMQGDSKERLQDQQLQRCQPRVHDDQVKRQQDVNWGNFSMCQSNMDSPFIV